MRRLRVQLLLPDVLTLTLMQDCLIRLTVGGNALRLGRLMEPRRVVRNDAADFAAALGPIKLLAARGAYV